MGKLTAEQTRAVIRDVINKNFTFADLANRFKNVDSSTGNIFCPFHENHESPAAKMYWDDRRDIWVLHCFGECHRSYTAADYVEIILCDRYEKYSSPLDFLKHQMSTSDLYYKLESSADQLVNSVQDRGNAKEEYINSVAEVNERVEDYIEALYTA